MPLNENERLALSADMTYDTVKEKLLYVNLRKGYLFEDGTPNPEFNKQLWYHQKFYRILGAIETRTMERLYELAKQFKEDNLNDYELLLELKRGKLQMFKTAKANGQLAVANSISDSIAMLLPYITSLREAIKHIMEDDVKKFEKQIEQNNLVPPGLSTTS